MTFEPTSPPTPPDLARPTWLPKQLRGQTEQPRAGELAIAVSPGGFGTAAHVLHDAGARFVTLHERSGPPRAISAVYALRGALLSVATPVGDDGRLHHGALSRWWPAAAWAEHELAERAGLAPAELGDTTLTVPDADALDRRVEGLDAFVIPYGPIRSGVFEAIQFQIETGGEDVPRLQTRPFFKHRALERRFRGLEPDRAVLVAERVAGIATIAHACAFSHAVERSIGVEPPVRAQRWRVVFAELERMANHLDVMAKEAETTALFVGQARFQILKEDVLRIQAALTGNRFARGAVVPGGVRASDLLRAETLLAGIDPLERDLGRDRRLFLSTTSLTDRLIGAGHLPRELIERYCAVGPLARGSGVSTDARHERPYGDYRRLGLEVATASGGDAMARITVRFDELSESLRILRQAADHLRGADGDLCAELPMEATGSAYGWAEAPQGEIVTWVDLHDGVVADLHIASPSLRNWALFSHAFPHDVLTDFAFIEHSFGLTAAGADR